MPPHLHPRSNATTTLFAGTLLASFVIVGLPHLYPCPSPRRTYADSERGAVQQLDAEGRPIPRRPRRRRREEGEMEAENGRVGRDVEGRRKVEEVGSGSIRKEVSEAEEQAEMFRRLRDEQRMVKEEGRECPVPKPKGLLGQLLGFDKEGQRVVRAEKGPGGS